MKMSKKSSKKNKSQLFTKSQMLPNSRTARHVLQKELARRTAVQFPNEPERLRKCANYTSPQLLDELHRTPHEQDEEAAIIAIWNDFKNDIREHYLKTSNNKEADLYKKLRLIESILHPELRDAFKQRNRQLMAFEIDARNSSKAGRSYYDEVAKMYNSETVLFSVDMGTDYGEPFQESFQLNQTAKTITGAIVKEYILSWKRPFIWIEDSISASGSGEADPRGTEVKQFCQKPRKDANGNVMAMGDALGYAFKRCKEEGVWDSVTATMDSESAATMENNPQIKTPRNTQSQLQSASKKRSGKQSRSSRKGKKKAKSSGVSDGYDSDDNGDPKMNLWNRVVGNQERTGLETKISDVRLQISKDEKLLVVLEECCGNRRVELRGMERELLKDGVKEEDFSGDRWWKAANDSYAKSTARIDEVTARVEEWKAELEKLQSQLQAGFDMEPTPVKSPRSSTRQRRRNSPSTGFRLFEIDKDQEVGSLDGSDDELNESYEPESIGMSDDNESENEGEE